jgi:hypothetical protein
MPVKPGLLTIGDPAQGGFRGGLNLCGSNNDLKVNQSPEMYNYIVSDAGLESRGGCLRDNANEVKPDTGLQGLFRYFDGTNNHTFAKCGNRVYEVLNGTNEHSIYLVPTVTEAGDAGNQLSNWSLIGGGNHNTDDGVLYWKLTNADTTRTVELYKNSNGAAENLVASGSRSGDGSISLSAQNDSGLTGTVSVTYTIDDDDLTNNTLTYWSMNADRNINFTALFDRYHFADGTNHYMGTTGTAAAVTPLDQDGNAITGTKPAFNYFIIHKQRLYGLNDTQVGFAERGFWDRWRVDDDGDFGAYLDDEFDRGDGNKLTGFISDGYQILVFKERKYFSVIGDYDDDNLEVHRLGYVGAYSQKAICARPDGMISWIGPDGIYEYHQSIGHRKISKNIDYELDKIDRDYIGLISIKSFGKYLLVTYPYGLGQAYNNRIFMADTEIRDQEGQPCWMQIRGWNMSCFEVYEDNSLHGARSNEGYIDKLFYSSSDNGNPITYSYKTKFFRVAPGMECTLDAVRALVQLGDNIDLNCRSDFATGVNYGIDITYPTVGIYLADDENPDQGGFDLGSDDDDTGDIMVSDDELGGTYIFEQKLPGGLDFKEVQFTISQIGGDGSKIDYVEVFYYTSRSTF